MNKQAECVRTVANWSIADKVVAYDHSSFDEQKMLELMPVASPKMEALFNKIRELDEADQRDHGKLFKHMIFTDIKSSAYGAKLLAGAFKAKGFTAAYDKSLTINEGALKRTEFNNFAVLCSTVIYGKPLGARFRKKILDVFNSRPMNVQGELIRFIILDQGFKEGIDLYDIKYIHLFEPLITTADEKQAVGRGTRLCGQKGLTFDPKRGWPLYVYRYEVGIPEQLQDKYNTSRLFDLFLRESGIDMRKLVFASTLETMSIYGAVDHDLTKNVHQFNIRSHDEPSTIGVRSLLGIISGGVRKKKKHHNAHKRVNAPRGKKTFDAMREYIKERFAKKYTWPAAKLENQCVAHGGADIVEFNPTQNFVRMFFQPHSGYKGMLLWHSTGTGKTCSAVATASTSWERQGYTILWVTRHTLKPDIWKNMYKQVCSLVIRDKIRHGELPEDAIKTPLKYTSKAWVSPLSYKQFSNMLAGKNAVYDDMVKRNGAADVLKKTLIIIDEAHKLFADDVVASERPNVGLIYKSILDSYDKSGADSARVLLMTATPYTSDPMHMIKLMNLMRPRAEAMKDEFSAFAEEYLDTNGKFSVDGHERFLNDITGYISYLNREKDARQFSYPVYENIIVPMTTSDREAQKRELDTLTERLNETDKNVKEGTDAVKKAKDKVREDREKLLKECDKLPSAKEKKACKDEVKKEMARFEKELLTDLNAKLADDKKAITELKALVKDKKKKLGDKKADFSQEAALQSRCGLK